MLFNIIKLLRDSLKTYRTSPTVCNCLKISFVDYVSDAQTKSQVTCVTYLNEGDHLHVKEITETSTDTQEKSLSSVRTMLASTQSALWDFFMDKSRRHEADGSFDKLTGQTFMERAKWIPLRLTLKERKVLRLVKAALNSSSYTARVDKTFKTKSRRLHTQVHEICAFLSGTVMIYCSSQTIFFHTLTHTHRYHHRSELRSRTRHGRESSIQQTRGFLSDCV